MTIFLKQTRNGDRKLCMVLCSVSIYNRDLTRLKKSQVVNMTNNYFDQSLGCLRICFCRNDLTIVSSNPNVIITRQTCGHGSSMLAGSKHQELAIYFFVRICFMRLMSNGRVNSDLGVCMTSRFAKRMRLSSASSMSGKNSNINKKRCAAAM